MSSNYYINKCFDEMLNDICYIRKKTFVDGIIYRNSKK